MTRDREMGLQVKLVRGSILEAVGCGTCAIGIAIDMVGQVYGDDPSTWALPGHTCALVRAGGVPPRVDERLKAIRASIKPMQPQQAPLHGIG